MKKTSHLIWSFSLALWLYDSIFKINLIQLILYSLITSFFSVLPDIDLKIINYFKKLNYRTFFISYPFYILAKIIFKHRGLTHSFLFSGLFYGIYYFIPKITNLNYFNIFNSNSYIDLILNLNIIFLMISIGIILHILEDSFTISGVRAFYPFNFKFRLLKFSTNSILDEIILNFIGFLIGIIFIIYKLNF